jgi:hypothetical protein
VNLSQLQAAVQAYGYGTDTAAQQTVFINAAYREVHSKQRWPFLEAYDTSLSTIAGVNTVSLATLGGSTPWRNLDAVRIQSDGTANSGQDMDYMQPQNMRSRETEYSDWSAKPRNWSVIDQTLHLWPIPDGVYTLGIDYIIEPPDLVNPTDTPLLPIPYHDVLVFGALKQIAMRERDLWSIGNYGAEYQRRLQEFEEEYFLRQRQTSSTVGHNRNKYGRFSQYGWIR